MVNVIWYRVAANGVDLVYMSVHFAVGRACQLLRFGFV